MNDKEMKRGPVRFSKAPQFQEAGEGPDEYEEDGETTESSIQSPRVISKARTGRERKKAQTPEQLEAVTPTRREQPADVWEERRKKLEKVAIYIGKKVPLL